MISDSVQTHYTSDVTYDKVANDHSGNKEGNTDITIGANTIPHGLDPLSTQHSEDDHERVEEVLEVPTGWSASCHMSHVVCCSYHVTCHNYYATDDRRCTTCSQKGSHLVQSILYKKDLYENCMFGKVRPV